MTSEAHLVFAGSESLASLWRSKVAKIMALSVTSKNSHRLLKASGENL
jgi:hypothetical protein